MTTQKTIAGRVEPAAYAHPNLREAYRDARRNWEGREPGDGEVTGAVAEALLVFGSAGVAAADLFLLYVPDSGVGRLGSGSGWDQALDGRPGWVHPDVRSVLDYICA